MSEDSVKSPSFENRRSTKEKSVNIKKTMSGSWKKTFLSIPEEESEDKSNIATKQTENHTIEEIFVTLKSEVDIGPQYAEIDEEVEQIFQPLKNKKTAIGKYYKHEDIVRDLVFNVKYCGNLFKIWFFLFIVYSCYEKFF